MSSSLDRKVTRRGFTKLVGSVFGVAGLALVLPGCGDDSSSSSSSSSSTDSSSTESTGTVDIKVCVSNQNKPYCYLDEDGTTITGYDVDSINLCNEKIGNKYNITWEALDFNTMISSLQSGSCDMVSCCLVQNDDRKAKFLFPDEAYLLAPMAILTREDSDIETLEDLAGLKVITSPTTYEYGMLQAYNAAHPDIAVELYEVDSGTRADYARMIANGQADASLFYISSFDSYEEAGDVELGHTDVVLVESCYYMLTQDNTELAEGMAEGLRLAKEDGSLGELSVEWFGEDVFTEYADVLTDNELLTEGEQALAAASADSDEEDASSSDD